MTIGVTWLWYLQGKLPDDKEAGQGQHTRTASLLRYLPHLEQMRNCSLHHNQMQLTVKCMQCLYAGRSDQEVYKTIYLR